MITGDSPEHHDIAQITSETGTYKLKGLVAGRYTLMAAAQDGTTGVASITVEEGETAALDILLGERS